MPGIADWIEEHAMTCTYKTFLGIECPGCGIQRSFVLLLRGDLSESLRMYPALIPTLCLLLFTIVHILFKIKNGHRIILILFIIMVTLMVGNYIIKQYHFFSTV